MDFTLFICCKKLWLFIVIVSVFTFFQPVKAYEVNCSQNLRGAEKKFETGNLSEVPPLLEACLKSGFSKEERITAYRLLVVTYLYLDDSVNAEINFLNLLRTSPDFKVSQATDPAELINLYQSYRTLPLFSYGFYGGMNVEKAIVLQNYGIDNSFEVSESYQLLPGFHGGFKLEVPLSTRIYISAEPNFKQMRYKYSRNLNTTRIISEDVPSYNYSKVQFKENQSWVNLPLLFGTTIRSRKVEYFFTGGASVGYLLGSKAEVTRKLFLSSLRGNEISGPEISVTALRNKINYWAILGTGVKIKTGLNFIYLEARYNHGLFNLVNPDRRYSISNLWNNYGFLDNDMKLSSIELSGSYMITNYKHQKIVR